MSEQEPTAIDKFEIVFRILGNEIFAMALTSQSKVKNWAVFGVIVLIALTFVFKEMAPVIEQIVDWSQVD